MCLTVCGVFSHSSCSIYGGSMKSGVYIALKKFNKMYELKWKSRCVYTLSLSVCVYVCSSIHNLNSFTSFTIFYFFFLVPSCLPSVAFAATVKVCCILFLYTSFYYFCFVLFYFTCGLWMLYEFSSLLCRCWCVVFFLFLLLFIYIYFDLLVLLSSLCVLFSFPFVSISETCLFKGVSLN